MTVDDKKLKVDIKYQLAEKLRKKLIAVKLCIKKFQIVCAFVSSR